jgi:hypothetical protein
MIFDLWFDPRCHQKVSGYGQMMDILAALWLDSIGEIVDSTLRLPMVPMLIASWDLDLGI